jgi:hypothetical protein
MRAKRSRSLPQIDLKEISVSLLEIVRLPQELPNGLPAR